MTLLEMEQKNLQLKDLTDQELDDLISYIEPDSMAWPAIAFEFQYRLSGRENYVPPITRWQ